MKTVVAPSSSIVQTTATALNEVFSNHSGTEFLFLSSGGSSLQLLDHIDPTNFGPHSTITTLDERYTTDASRNNMAQLESTNFYTKIRERGANFIDTKIQENESMENAAKRIERALHEWVDRTNGIIIATVGVGPDAHTSGVMPYPEDPKFFTDTFDNPTHWVAAYDAKEKSSERLRITSTIPFFRKINIPILFITGENKRPALEKLFADTGSVNESPCRIWREVPNAVLYTDISI